MRESGEEFIPNRDYLVGLPAHLGYLPAQGDISTVAKHSAKRITGKRSWPRLLPGHDHPSVQSTCQRHGDLLVTIEIARQVLRESLEELAVIGFWVECFLIFPLSWMEIASLTLECTVAKDP